MTTTQVAGMIVYYIMSGGRHPFGDDMATCEINIKYGRPCLHHVTDDVYLNFLCWMLHHEVDKRKSVDDCLA